MKALYIFMPFSNFGGVDKLNKEYFYCSLVSVIVYTLFSVAIGIILSVDLVEALYFDFDLFLYSVLIFVFFVDRIYSATHCNPPKN
jgi:hypothetical protein